MISAINMLKDSGSGPGGGDELSPMSMETDTELEATPVVVLPGDGIGPEIVAATLRVVEAAYPRIDWMYFEAGAEVFRKGLASGVPRETIDAIAKTGVVLKGPLETPIGYGEKSANVTLRKLFELFGNIRPVRELPGIRSPFAGRGIDLVVLRENVEDLYAGIEHMQTPSVAQCLKLISRTGSEKIARLAFELVRAEGRGSVHCATKANIMKLTEGLLKQTFERVAEEYPKISSRHIVVDNCAHRLVMQPEAFDVIVTSNMNGDILSDLAAGLVGGLGLAPSANIGQQVAMFEAVHGSAPDIAGQGTANPTALILSAVMLLRHIGAFEAAESIEHALFVTLEEGRCLTADIVRNHSPVSTDRFTDEIIANLGRRSAILRPRTYSSLVVRPELNGAEALRDRHLDGVDIFVEWDAEAEALAHRLMDAIRGTPFKLEMISNRGMKVYPANGGQTETVDHWRCRFIALNHASIEDDLILELLRRIGAEHRWMHVEKLQRFDGQAGYTRAQGEG